MKSNLTQSNRQEFLKTLKEAEYKIKKTITEGMLNGSPLFRIREEVDIIIDKADKELPKDVIDRESYIQGLKDSAEEMIQESKKSRRWMLLMALLLLLIGKKAKETASPLAMLQAIRKLKGHEISKIKREAESIESIEGIKGEIEKAAEICKVPEKEAEKLVGKAIKTEGKPAKTDGKTDMWAEAKGWPNVEDYEKKLKEYIGEASKTDLAPKVEGKRRITMWQKAELDLRHQAQLQMLDDLKKQGVKLAWTSSHPDCSERCEKWQGKLFDLEANPEKGYEVGKVDGITVYSLKKVMSKKDKYGYENNIINGFNCRHRLIPYEKGVKPVTPYTAEEVAEQRDVNARIRQYERDIRHLKTKAGLIQPIDPKEAKRLMAKAKELTAEYKRYCESHGYAWNPYRI